MPSELPFTISPEAEEYLSARKVPLGHEAGLTAANSFEVRDLDGNVTDRHEGLHFSIGYDGPGYWSGTHLKCGSVEFWIPEASLKVLQGKTLKLIRRYEGDKQLGRVQNLLVAV